MVPESLRPYLRSRTRRAHGGLIVTRSPNEERALAPVIGVAPDLRRASETAIAGSAALDAVTRRVKQRVDAFLDRHDRPELRASWRHAVNATQHELRRLENVDLTPYRYILLARQTHPLLRALILRAEEQGVPVIYVPHSPLTRFQVDLPVSFAALRGDAERTWVAATAGIDPERIAVVGNPSTDITRLPSPDIAGSGVPGVFAVSPDPEQDLHRMFTMLTHAGLEEVLVAPHPRSDIAMLERLMPTTWSLHRDGLTVDLLRHGPRWVIQNSSGVAWESALLGIPTADIRLDERPPAYPFLEDEQVFPALHSAEDVRAFVAGAGDVDRARLQALAHSWCATDGEEAVSLTHELLARVSSSEPRIVDAWAPGGVLHRTSALADL
ncbi:hypothetical protein [Microbacterium sp. JZ31]|uniref:hypothetical protein n=1 Tax=Microbacterium sp. JZ31 TaxID=1906274 RepID=UPI0019333A65|nr:hypothetical protein [Microbacterium sp. JZ31]